MRQRPQQFGTLGLPRGAEQRRALPSSEAQQVDVAMEQAEQVDLETAKGLVEKLYEFYKNYINTLTFDKLLEFQNKFNTTSNNELIQQIHEHVDDPKIYGDIKGTPMLETVKQLIGNKFVDAIKREVERTN
jgi:hypothetical protein